MTAYNKCDRCSRIGPATEFEKLWASQYAHPYTEGSSIINATYLDVQRGRVVKKDLTPVHVDLCRECRQDLNDFFRNIQVSRRQSE